MQVTSWTEEASPNQVTSPPDCAGSTRAQAGVGCTITAIAECGRAWSFAMSLAAFCQAPYHIQRPRSSAVGGSSCSTVPAALSSRGTLEAASCCCQVSAHGAPSGRWSTKSLPCHGHRAVNWLLGACGQGAEHERGVMLEASELKRMHMRSARLRRELQLVSASEAEQRSMLQWSPFLELPMRQPMHGHTRVPRLPRGTSRCRTRAGGRHAQQWLYVACKENARASWKWPETGASRDTQLRLQQAFRRELTPSWGHLVLVDADTQMGRAAESLREGAAAIEAPAAVIEMQQQAPGRERELTAKHGQWSREVNQHRP